MSDDSPDFSAIPSRPRATRLERLVIYFLLLLFACAAIWWIDRGATLTNTSSAVPMTPTTSPR